MKRFFGILLVVLIYHQSIGQTMVTLELQKSSSFIILGSTSLLKFKLTQSGEKLQKKLLNATITPIQNRLNLSQNLFPIALKDFSSDNIIALKGFLNLVKSEEYPNIFVQLNYLLADNKSNKNQTNSAKANLNFTITGVTKAYNIPINVTHLGEQYQINGNIKVNIRDFGLAPPIYMMGLVKVSEWIEIEFNLICKISLDTNKTELTSN